MPSHPKAIQRAEKPGQRRAPFRAASANPSNFAVPVNKGLNAVGNWRAIAALMALSVVLLLVAGTPHTFALGILLGVPGLLLIFRPGLFRIGFGAEQFNALVLLLPLLSLLPIVILPGLGWRREALGEVGLDLGPLLTISPLRSWEGWLFLFATMVWSYFVVSRPIDRAGRKWMLLYMSFIGGVLGLIAVVGNLFPPLWMGAIVDDVFSPLADPALFGCLIAGGGVIAFGAMVEGLKRRQLPQMITTVFLAAAFAGLFYLGSPTAFSLFFLGSVGWLILRIVQSSAHWLIKVASALLIPGGLIYGMMEFGFGEALRGEYYLSGGVTMLSAMLREAPLTGFGILTAESWATVFADADFDGSRRGILGWWLVETGLAGAALGIFGIIVFVRRTRLLSPATEGIHQQVAAIGAGIVWLGWILRGSLQDAAYLFFAATLTAVAFVYQRSGKQMRLSTEGREAINPGKARLAAVVCCLLSGAYLFSTITGLKLQDRQMLVSIQDRIAVIQTTGEDESLRSDLPNLYDELIARRPLIAEHHAERGLVALRTGGDPESAREDFARARYLNPEDSGQMLTEAVAWTRYQPTASIEAWDRLLQRSVTRGEMRTLVEQYRALLENWGNPGLDRLIQRYARQQPILFPHYLMAVPDSVFVEEVSAILARGQVATYSPEEQRRFALRALLARENEMTDEILGKMPSDDPITWQTRQLVRFQRGEFEDATRTVLAAFEHARPLPDLEFDEIGKRLEAFERIYNSNNPDRMEAGESVVAYFINRDFISEARRLTQRMMRQGEAPDFAVFWMANYFYRMEDYVDAWETLQYVFPYLQMPARSDLASLN